MYMVIEVDDEFTEASSIMFGKEVIISEPVEELVIHGKVIELRTELADDTTPEEPTTVPYWYLHNGINGCSYRN